MKLQPDKSAMVMDKGKDGKHGGEPTMSKSQTKSFSAATLPPRPIMWHRMLQRVSRVAIKYAKSIGPGFMISIAYIDPGNYATDVAAGATYRFHLLFMILLSNMFAIFLQSLCIKLGSVTGLNLAEMCKAYFPTW